MAEDSLLPTKLDESAEHWPADIGSRIELVNPGSAPVDGDALAERLCRLKEVTHVQVGLQSTLRDVRFVRSLPSLKTLVVAGRNIQSLDGLETFRGSVSIDTSLNRRRTLSHLAGLSLTHLAVSYGRPEDLADIGQVVRVESLRLSKFPHVTTAALRSCNPTYLGLHGGGTTELRDTAEIESLRQVGLFACRKLETFEGDNSALTWLVVDACQRLALETLVSAPHIRALTVVGTREPIRAGVLRGLRHLEELSLRKCFLDAALSDVALWWPSLRKGWFGGLKRPELEALSRHVPTASISNGICAFRGGDPIALGED